MAILDVYEEVRDIHIDHGDSYHSATPVRGTQQDYKPHFQVHHADFRAIIGVKPKIKLAMEDARPLFHEAAVFLPDAHDGNDALIVTSSPMPGQNNEISRLTRKARDDQTWTRSQLPADDMPMANGAVNYAAGSILYCAQGTTTHAGGLALATDAAPDNVKYLATSYHGRWFNSVNDVVVARDRAVWFTDPYYGHDQGFRPRPQLPPQLYRLDLDNQSLRAVADGFGRPNGLCFDPAESTLYVTDTDYLHVTGKEDMRDDTRVSNIYAFTVEKHHGAPFLTNRRLFATADAGIPDGIKCDNAGNIYSGCADGVNVWAPSGILLGKIIVPGGVANFCFGRPGELLVLNETRFWVVNVDAGVKGDLLESLGIDV